MGESHLIGGVAYARGRRKCMYQILLVEDDRALALAV